MKDQWRRVDETNGGKVEKIEEMTGTNDGSVSGSNGGVN